MNRPTGLRASPRAWPKQPRFHHESRTLECSSSQSCALLLNAEYLVHTHRHCCHLSYILHRNGTFYLIRIAFTLGSTLTRLVVGQGIIYNALFSNLRIQDSCFPTSWSLLIHPKRIHENGDPAGSWEHHDDFKIGRARNELRGRFFHHKMYYRE